MLNYLREMARNQNDASCSYELFDEIIQWADKMINKFFLRISAEKSVLLTDFAEMQASLRMDT